MIMVVLEVNDMIAKTKYINPEEMKDERNEKELRLVLEEKHPHIFENSTFQELRIKAYNKNESDMRQVYTNHISRLCDTDTYKVNISEAARYQARQIIKEYNNAKDYRSIDNEPDVMKDVSSKLIEEYEKELSK
jgi:DNA integrity scanning protein DisA with diadenylate cyclase activity